MNRLLRRRRYRELTDAEKDERARVQMAIATWPTESPEVNHVLRAVEPTDVLDARGNVVVRGVRFECSCGYVFTHPADAVRHARQ